MRNFFISASIAAIMAVGTANAADIVVRNSAPRIAYVPESYWTGFYFGVQGGFGFARDRTTYSWRKKGMTSINDKKTTFEEKHSFSPNGTVAGAFTGVNYEVFDNMVFSVDSDIAWNGQKIYANKNFKSAYDPKKEVSVEFSTKYKWMGATRARFGYVGGDFMPYFAAGVAYANVETSTKFYDKAVKAAADQRNAEAPAIAAPFQNGPKVGWTAGTGVDYAINDNMMARFEYRYSNYGQITACTSVVKSEPVSEVSFKKNIDDHAFRAGIAYKF